MVWDTPSCQSQVMCVIQSCFMSFQLEFRNQVFKDIFTQKWKLPSINRPHVVPHEYDFLLWSTKVGRMTVSASIHFSLVLSVHWKWIVTIINISFCGRKIRVMIFLFWGELLLIWGELLLFQHCVINQRNVTLSCCKHFIMATISNSINLLFNILCATELVTVHCDMTRASKCFCRIVNSLRTSCAEKSIQF